MLVSMLAFWRSGQGRLIGLLGMCLLLGAWRYTTVSPRGDPTAISAFTGAKQIEINGNVADEPLLETRSTLLTIDVQQISVNNGATWQNARGQLEVQIPGNTLDDPYGAHYGDTVELSGKLQPPQSYNPPSIFASMTFPRLSVQQSGGNPLLALLYELRIRLALIIQQALPQPMAALLIALLLSLRTPALRPLIPGFNVTGTAHLIAPSGFKITILSGVIANAAQRLAPRQAHQFRRLLPAERRKRDWRGVPVTGLVIACTLAYTFLSGGSPAALRAGIMGIVLAVAPREGRTYNVYTALAFSAIALSVADPFVLWDTGFQLSFLGTLGIVMLTPLWLRLLHPLEGIRFVGPHIAEIFAVTLAAETATLPIFALSFQQVSFIAPLVNVLTVPLLAYTILLGLSLGLTGLVSLSVALAIGRVAWPLLWYLQAVVTWCAHLPGAYLTVTNLNPAIAWAYYALLLLFLAALLKRLPEPRQAHLLQSKPLQLQRSKHMWLWVQFGAALLIFLATGTAVIAARNSATLTITFLDVAPAGQPPQGEAILIRTPDGKTALIDGGLDATSLGTLLDARLPFWQRSLDMVILTAPRQEDLTGLTDIVTRYEIGEVIDAGMLHPNTGYALWRHTIDARHLPYAQLRQGATFMLGALVTFQVLWPVSPLHKSSQEDQDNGLALRVLAPGVSLLLLGDTSTSNYALDGLQATIDPRYLSADIVQVVGEASKPFPASLPALLRVIHPSLVVVTPSSLSSKLRKSGASSVLPSLAALDGSWQFAQTAQVGTLEISSDGQAWTMQADA